MMIRNIILLFMFNDLLARKYLVELLGKLNESIGEKNEKNEGAGNDYSLNSPHLEKFGQNKVGQKRLGKSGHKRRDKARTIGVENKEPKRAGNDYSIDSRSEIPLYLA